MIVQLSKRFLVYPTALTCSITNAKGSLPIGNGPVKGSDSAYMLKIPSAMIAPEVHPKV